jgi:methyl-accepting chemotaxis protein
MLQSINVLKNMKVGLKLGLVIFFMVIPIMSLIALLFSNEQKLLQAARSELNGIEYLGYLKDISLHIPQHSDLNKLYLSGDSSQEERMTALQLRIDQAFQTLAAAETEHGQTLKTADIFQELRQSWDRFRQDWKELGPIANAEHHAQLNVLTNALRQQISRESKLRLDPEALTSMLLDTLVDTLPFMMRQLEQLRGLGVSIVSRKVITFEEEGRLGSLLAQVTLELQELDDSMAMFAEHAGFNTELESLMNSVRTSSESFLDTVREGLLEDESLAITTAEFFEIGTESIAKFSAFYDAVLETLQNQLQTRISQTTNRRNMQLLIALMLTAVAVLVAAVSNRYITAQIGAILNVFDQIDQGSYDARSEVFSADELGFMASSLNDMLDRNLSLIQSQDERDSIQNAIMKLLDDVSDVAKGDLTVEAEITEDVTGAIADSFNHMIYQLRQIVMDVQEATLQVSASANEIQSTAEQLAEGSSAQAEQIVDSSAALDEMAVSIQQVSENASLSATVAEQALANAKQGATAVQNTIQGMHRIRSQVQETSKRIKRLGERSQEISEIVQLIGDIADRTSILALNASIQAARAGEAGRSFAVVAEEVERLAERSTNATKQIASLVNTIQSETNEAVMAMEESTHEVVQGSQVADKAGQALGEIEGVSSRLAELIQSISLAATQQARGSDNLSKAMSEISEVTQQTATGTRQAASSISSLATLADELRSSVSTFKLPMAANR